MMIKKQHLLLSILLFILSCTKNVSTDTSNTTPQNDNFSVKSIYVVSGNRNFNVQNQNELQADILLTPNIDIVFSDTYQVNTESKNNFILADENGKQIELYIYAKNFTAINLVPLVHLSYETNYTLTLSKKLASDDNINLPADIVVNFKTIKDPSIGDKYPRISDMDLLTLIQSSTFNYFYTTAHPNCGMALERRTSGNIVTTGGTGFYLMSIPIAIKNNFISRTKGLEATKKL